MIKKSYLFHVFLRLSFLSPVAVLPFVMYLVTPSSFDTFQTRY